jgi:dipeptidyl aminopeptidase/acylaminoacyl peptidase
MSASWAVRRPSERSLISKAFQVLGTCLVVGLLIMVLGMRPSAHASGQSASNRVPQKLPITAVDSVGMTRVPEQDPSTFRALPIGYFSPDQKRFLVLLRKSNVRRNTNDFSLLLYRSSEAFRTPKPHVILIMASTSNRDAIQGIRWLKDNETIVFLGEKPHETSQVYAVSASTGVLRRLTNHPTNILYFDITDDGKHLAFLAERPEVKASCSDEKPCGETVLSASDWSPSNFDLNAKVQGKYASDKGRQLFMQSLGHVPRAVPVPRTHLVGDTQPFLSPDGQYVLFQAFPREMPSEWLSYQTPGIRQIAALPLQVSMPPEYLVSHAGMMSAVLIDTPAFGFDAPVWANDGKSVFLNSYLPLDVADAAERDARAKTEYPIEVSLSSGEFRKVDKDHFPSLPARQPSLDVTLEQDLNTPPTVYVSGAGQQKALLLDLNPQFRELEFGKVKNIEFKSDGLDVQAGLYLPPDYVPGRRYPLVIQTHGFQPREFSMDGLSEWSSAFAARPLAARGIIVLQAASHKIHGEEDRLANSKTLGTTPEESYMNIGQNEIEAAIDYLDREGYIDRNRVGIVGFSRTVCLVARMLTHSEYRFAAAELVDGIDCGYFSNIAYPLVAGDGANINGGALPFGDGLKLWLQNSPSFSLDKVQAPVRLVSLGDAVLSLWEWYAGLSLQKKPVDYVAYPNAVHIASRPSDRVSLEQGLMDWFCFWLKGEEDPDPAKTEQYARWRELRKMQQDEATGPEETPTH